MPTKKRIQYRYTPTGQRSLLIDPDGGRFTYLYDNVKRLTTVINPQGERTSYVYDAAGRRTLKKLANGSRTSFTYNAASRITSVAHLKSDASLQAKYEYQYDKAGNRTAMAETGATTARTTWSYDAAYQLTGEHRTGSNAFLNTFAYDKRGNRTLEIKLPLPGLPTVTTFAYDAANQLRYSQQLLGRTTYTFDADGNQHVVQTPNGDRTTNVWDYENKLVGVQHPAGSRETMAYDPDGKRVKLQETATTTKYVWDDQNYLQETDANDVTQVTYTNEPRTYGNLISQRKAGASHYYLFDALGSTRLVTDASENVAESLLYDAWGNLVGSTPTLAVPFRWVGELGYLFVPVTSDYYVRARVYQPGIGRWISQDPLGFLTSESSMYWYAENFVIGSVDASGMIPVCCGRESRATGRRTKDAVDCPIDDASFTGSDTDLAYTCCAQLFSRRHWLVYDAILGPCSHGSPDSRCDIALHCWPPVPLVSDELHCGLTFRSNRGVHTVDGRGGRWNGILLDKPHERKWGWAKSYEAWQCECLWQYRYIFNNVDVDEGLSDIPRNTHQGNSNWVLWCMITECQLDVTEDDWRTFGREPYKYGIPPCKCWQTVAGPMGHASQECVESYSCPRYRVHGT